MARPDTNRFMTPIGSCVAAATIGIMGTVALCSGQSVEFTPYVGVYAPTSNVIDESGAFCSAIGRGGNGPITCGTTVRQRTTLAVGARVTAWPSKRFGVDLAWGYAMSGVRGMTYNESGPRDTSANVTTVTARLLISVIPHDSKSWLYLTAGPALIVHSGAAYTDFNRTTAWGPAVGVAARFHILRSLVLRADVQDYLYTADFEDTFTQERTGGQTQNDFVVSLGLSVSPFTSAGLGR